MNFADPKEIILALKQVYDEKGLSIDRTLSLVNERIGEGAVSRSTIQAVFAKGSENGTRNFGYDTVLKPLCSALLDIENDEDSDSVDTVAYKSLLRFKAEMLDDYKAENERLKAEIQTIKDREKAKYAEALQKETNHFNQSVDFLRNQISLKDSRIDKLMDSNERLSKTNDKLINQLMDCPLRKCNEDRENRKAI